MRRCRLSRLAEQDIREIGDFIAKDSPRRAAAFVAELRARCQDIGRSPKAATLRPEFGAGIRVVVFGRYLLAYHEEEDGSVLVDRVVHGARDLNRLFPG